MSHPRDRSTLRASTKNALRLIQWNTDERVIRSKSLALVGIFSADGTQYSICGSRGANAMISAELSIPTMWRAMALRLRVDDPVPQPTSRARVTGSASDRYALMRLTTCG